MVMKYVLSKPISIHELGQRANQEDSQYPSGESLNEAQRFFILCDGMGGHESGEVASSTVCECMGGYMKEHLSAGEQFSNNMFENALAAAYDGLDSKDKPDTVKKMGTTMTFLMFHDSGVTAAHIGDSRIYQFRPGVVEPIFKSRDHSLVNDLIMLGELTEEEARTSLNKNVITRAMQPGQENRAKADMTLLTDVKADDWFYMCSDGMLEEMDDAVLGGILTDTSMTADEKRDLLIRRTSSNRDNHTAFIIHVEDVIRDSEGVTAPTRESKMAASNRPVSGSKATQKQHGLPKWFYSVIAVLVGVVVLFFFFKPKPSQESAAAPTESGTPAKSNTRPKRNPKKDSLGAAELKTIAVASISLSETSLTLAEGGTSILMVNYTPADATDKGTVWNSSDTNVVTVDGNGKVTAVKTGSAQIIVTCGDKEASCNVTVKAKAGAQFFNQSPTTRDAPNEATPQGNNIEKDKELSDK